MINYYIYVLTMYKIDRGKGGGPKSFYRTDLIHSWVVFLESIDLLFVLGPRLIKNNNVSGTFMKYF